ncbi:TPA: hypothetical protein ACH3X2_011028 [Trebouxia sp. C0005]
MVKQAAVLKLALPASFTLDVFCHADQDFAVKLIELNSFGAQLAAGSCLFDWVKDYEMLYGLSNILEDAGEDMELSDSKMEHVLIFGLLCCMGLYLAKVLFSFKSSGLSLRRDTDDEELVPIDEDEIDVDDTDHAD